MGQFGRIDDGRNASEAEEGAEALRLAQLVVRLRSLLGWTQTDLAHAAGVTKRTVQRVEAGEAPGEDLRFRLADALGSDDVMWAEPEALADTAALRRVDIPAIVDGRAAVEVTTFVCARRPEADKLGLRWKNDEPETREEAEAVAAFFAMIERGVPARRTRAWAAKAAGEFDEALRDLNDLGWMAFSQVMLGREFHSDGHTEPVWVWDLLVLRSANPMIDHSGPRPAVRNLMESDMTDARESAPSIVLTPYADDESRELYEHAF